MNTPRILIVGVDWMGDVIFSTPLIRAIKKKFPGCFLAYSTSPSCEDILKNNPNIDHVISYDEKPFLLGLREHTRFVLEIRRLCFDTAVFLHRSSTRAFLCVLGGIHNRVGNPSLKRKWMLTHSSKEVNGVHRIDKYLACAQPLGLPDAERYVEVFLSDKDRVEFSRLKDGTPLSDMRRYAVVHPGGNWDLKRWPAGHFSRVLGHLEKCGITTVLCGTKREIELSEGIIRGAQVKNAVSLAGKTNIRTLAAILEGSTFLISGDSGPLHLASGLGVPVIALFGPTSPLSTGPVSRAKVELLEHPGDCAVPCYVKTCDHNRCMEGLGPERVIHAIDSLINQ